MEVDAGMDASPPSDGVDATGTTGKFDVGYIDNFTLTPDITSLFGFLTVVNTGTVSLRLATASVVMFSDDNTSVNVVFAKEAGSTAMLAPGRAAGFLSPLAQTKINTIVAEPIDDQTLNFSMSFGTPLTAGISLQVQAVLAIDNVRVTVPITINVVDTDVQFNSAKRVSSLP